MTTSTGTNIDWDRAKSELSYIANAEHMGDVNNALADLVAALGLGKCTWGENGWQLPWHTYCDVCGYRVDEKYGCECPQEGD